MAVALSAPRLQMDFCRNEVDRSFFDRLNERAREAGWFADSWPHADGHVILSVCPYDSERNVILRALRVDYVGPNLLFGEDETHQFATDLDPARPGVTLVAGGDPVDLANQAADWLKSEISRPIVREEWIRAGQGRERYVLVETGKVLVRRGNWDALVRQSLGSPDKRITVWPIGLGQR